tara:strand:+ start:3851 stop:4207 length:357 start_codon:yes stop_codon:yes gene_type:complete
MSFDWNVESNHNHSANYQVSGLPFTAKVAAAVGEVDLPRVSRWVVLKATGGTATVKFTSNGAVTGFDLAANEMTPRLELRCTKIYFTGAGSTLHVIAGLTTCDKDTFIPDSNFNYPDP